MRKLSTTIFLVVFLVSINSLFAQGLMDYVKEVKGDVLVLNDYYDMGEQANSLRDAIQADSVDVPAGRVYELQAYGWYPASGGFTTPTDRAVIIEGEYKGQLVQIAEETDAPPIISGFSSEGASDPGSINWGNRLTVKNSSIVQIAPDGNLGWAFFGSAAADVSLTLDNCMMEHNRWIFIQSNGHALNSFYLTDNYFVNMTGQPCRRNGGVYDNTENNTDTMYVENNTHVMAQGYIYKFRNFPVNFIYVNNNTFVNMSSVIFETKGFQSKSIITNNIFVNCQAQPFRPNMTEDVDEQNAAGFPQGIIDVLDSLDVDRKYLVQNNLIYWDSSIKDLATPANAENVGGFDNWVNQTMTMNEHTQGLFDDNVNFPYLTESGWIEDKLPNFANTEDLFTTQLEELRKFSLYSIDSLSTNALPVWRLINTGAEDYIYTDFPIPIDLSYDDSDLLVASTHGFPLGDLNWFPTQKTAFEAQKDVMFAEMVAALEAGNPISDVVEEIGGIANEFKLSQNYPNPFNPTTVINFSVPKAGVVSLKVYNSLGQEVATLVDGFKNAQNYQVTFDAATLSSGVYYYSLSGDNFVQTKKMVLMK